MQQPNGLPREAVIDSLADSSRDQRPAGCSLEWAGNTFPPGLRRAQEASRRLPILIVFPLVFFFLPALLIIYLAPPLLHLFLGR